MCHEVQQRLQVHMDRRCLVTREVDQVLTAEGRVNRTVKDVRL